MKQFPKHHTNSLADLDLFKRLDAEYPVGEAAAWSAAEARENVPHHRNGYPRIYGFDLPIFPSLG